MTLKNGRPHGGTVTLLALAGWAIATGLMIWVAA